MLVHPINVRFWGEKRNIMCSTLYVTHDLGACQASANEMLRVASKYDLPVYRAIGSFWLGATQEMHGDLTGGLRQMEPSFEPLDSIGLFVLLPAVVMVDTLARAGRDRDALALIARERGGDMALAEQSFQEALQIARGQEAMLLQSRAGVALARHFAERGRREEAKMALAESGVSALADRTAPEIVAADRLSAALG